MTFNLLVVLPAHHMGFATPFVLLATSTCLSAALNAFLLWRGLRAAGVYQPRAGWGALLGRVLLANAVMAGVLLALSHDLSQWLAEPPLHRALHLAGLILAGAAAYAAVLWLAGLRPAHLRAGEGR
jgi:putative peptidoglycan lipid II flippase